MWYKITLRMTNPFIETFVVLLFHHLPGCDIQIVQYASIKIFIFAFQNTIFFFNSQTIHSLHLFIMCASLIFKVLEDTQ